MDALQTRLDAPYAGLTEDGIQQMVGMAERLREEKGGVLDDSAIAAISEVTGAPEEYVRLAVKLHADTEQKSPTSKVRAAFLSLQPNVRRHVSSGLLGSAIGLAQAMALFFSSMAQYVRYNAGPTFDILRIILVVFGLYNISVSRDNKSAAVSGAILCGTGFAVAVALGSLAGMRMPDANYLLFYLGLGAVSGATLHAIVNKYRGLLGLKDPVKERQDLLRQLVDLQDKLRSGEQSITFLSVDIVGSTKMKEYADPLSIEFTFNEYHRFVEMITQRYGGRVHSTAGDGVTCAFDSPQQAFGAGRTIQTGLIEVNTHRNKIGVPLKLRVGIHTGKVVAPDAEDIKSVNFAHVIDLAAHLQKVCPVGGVAISEIAAAHIPGGPAAIGIETVEVDNMNAVVWMPRAMQRAQREGGPPPVPKLPKPDLGI